MAWLEKHMNGFFKITGILVVLVCVFDILAIIEIGGIPNNPPSTWTSFQWYMIDFLWRPTLIDSIIYLLLAFLCFKRKYIAFPCIVINIARYFDYGVIGNIFQILKYGFIYPAANVLGILGIITFCLSLIGTLLWTKRVIKRWA